jgi:hypothetical protein
MCVICHTSTGGRSVIEAAICSREFYSLDTVKLLQESGALVPLSLSYAPLLQSHYDHQSNTSYETSPDRRVYWRDYISIVIGTEDTRLAHHMLHAPAGTWMLNNPKDSYDDRD